MPRFEQKDSLNKWLNEEKPSTDILVSIDDRDDR